MTVIDNVVSEMNLEELQNLNKKVVSRIKELRCKSDFQEAVKYSKGDSVTFKGTYGRILTGTIKRVNKKTLTIIEDGPFGGKWRVSYVYIVK